MANFENLKKYVGNKAGAIRFQKVEDSEISEAEKLLGFSLPIGLKEFYGEIGYGWISDESRPTLRNLIIHPLDIIDLFNGESEFSPPDEFLEGDLPIFDCGGDRFLVVRTSASNPEKIYRDDGTDDSVADNLEDLINKLIANPGFYEK